MTTLSIEVTYNLGTHFQSTCVFNIEKATSKLALKSAEMFTSLYFGRHGEASVRAINFNENLPKVNTNVLKGKFNGHIMWGANNQTKQRVSNAR